MGIGTIAQAIRLIKTGITTKSSYTYYFATSFPTYAAGAPTGYNTAPTGGVPYSLSAAHFLNLTSASESAVAASLTAIDRAAGLSFNYLNDDSADIVISGLSQALYTPSGSSVAAFAFFPSGTHQTRSDLWVIQTGAPPADLHAYVLHELLHTIGLDDVGTGTAAIFSGIEDTSQYTVMSYNSHPEERRRATELQIYDIAALQAIYGRDDSYNDGPTTISQFTEIVGTYVGQDRIFSIWDGAGKDTIDASSLSVSALIDLRPRYFSSIGPNAGVVVAAGSTPTLVDDGRSNVSIAFGAYIEDAQGSSAGDLIIGNILTNKLIGNGGADVIYAEGKDSFHLPHDGVYDRVTSSGSTKTAAPPAEVQSFISNPSVNKITFSEEPETTIFAAAVAMTRSRAGGTTITSSAAKETTRSGAAIKARIRAAATALIPWTTGRAEPASRSTSTAAVRRLP
jgi:serralysin